MRINLLIKTICFSVFAFLMAFICYHYSQDIFATTQSKYWDVFKNRGNYKTFVEDVSFQDIHTVIIESASADIEINKEAKQASKVLLTTGLDKNNAFHAEKKDHELFIKLGDLTAYPYSTLTLKIPADVQTITIKNDSGNVQLNKMKLGKLVINNLHGDIQLKSGTIKQAHLNSMNGDVLCSSEIKNLQVKTVSGDIKVKTINDHPNYNLSTVSGDINLSLPTTLKAKVNLQSATGDVMTKNKLAHSESKDQGVINASTVNGDVTVE